MNSLIRWAWILVVTLTTIGSVSAAAGAGIGFYVVETAIESSVHLADIDLSELDLVGEPTIGTADIEAYDWSTHTMLLTEECRDRMNSMDGTGTPEYLKWKHFVVTVDGERIYIGMWRSQVYSTLPTDAPVIPLPNHGQVGRELWIERRGAGEDVRSDSRIRAALVSAGVLGEE